MMLREQEELSEAINGLAEDPDKFWGVITIIRELATLTGNEEEIELEIDQLDTATQRKLQRFVMRVSCFGLFGDVTELSTSCFFASLNPNENCLGILSR